MQKFIYSVIQTLNSSSKQGNKNKNVIHTLNSSSKQGNKNKSLWQSFSFKCHNHNV